MSTTTANLGLFKYNTTTDANVAFNINTALNDNWDKIDTAMAGGGLPDQTDKDGYILTTNGSEASWGETDEVYPIVETYQDGFSWYRIYSDGWCEQGGRTTASSSASKVISFLKQYKDITYTVYFGMEYTAAATATPVMITGTKTITGFTLTDSGTTTIYTNWMTCGYMN